MPPTDITRLACGLLVFLLFHCFFPAIRAFHGLRRTTDGETEIIHCLNELPTRTNPLKVKAQRADVGGGWYCTLCEILPAGRLVVTGRIYTSVVISPNGGFLRGEISEIPIIMLLPIATFTMASGLYYDLIINLLFSYYIQVRLNDE